MRAKENKSVTVIDQPTTEDRFEVANYVNALADFIRICDTPMTISLQGDWGTGKTSFMKMVQEKLADTTIPIEFNVWQYSQFNMEEQLPFLLLERLTDKITSGTDNNTRLVKILLSVFKHMIDIAAAAASGGNVNIDWDAVHDRINALNELLETLTLVFEHDFFAA